MCGIFLYYTLGLLLFVDILSSAPEVDYVQEISVFEYGNHDEEEEPSFAMNGHVPELTQLYRVNVTPPRPDLDKRFTYLRVEYHSPMSSVTITYDPDKSMLMFYVPFPFREIPFGIVGYSLKAQRRRKWSSWRKCRCNKNI